MKQALEVLFTPVEFNALPARDLSRTVCVVFDVLRATSVMVQALSEGAEGLIPVSTIEEAVALHRLKPELLLAGERHGLRITAPQSGGVDFLFGNSPWEFTAEKVKGRTIVTTTTNGTRALQACRGAAEVLVGAFLNLDAVADRLLAEQDWSVVIVCSGTGEEAAYEDTLAAGALCEVLLKTGLDGRVVDSAQIARAVYEREKGDLMGAMQRASNGVRLLGMTDLKDDVTFCLRRNAVPLVAAMGKDGVVRRLD
ncbi:MAG: 2-phosphosulfolactate phosphatase [Verrucomicrobia bacterium]|nr:2-phosphosulfolactate phosphatase [Verrucomicrobiota bacterium]